MVVSGMEAPGETKSEDAENVLSVLATESRIDKNIANNIDKAHPIGATLDNKQQCIIKFKSEKYTQPKKNQRNMINAGTRLILNHLSHEEESSCCPVQMIKSRIMIQSNLSLQKCMKH